MLRKLWSVIGLVTLLCLSVSANNVTIKGEVKVQAKDASTALLTFPLSWENSWRTGQNWDAVWIFAKYKRKGVNEPWHHLYLKEGGEFRARGADNIPAMEFLPQYTMDYWPLRYDTLYLGNAIPNSTGVTKRVIPGVFMFRKKAGTGDIHIPRLSLEWDFKEGDLNLYYDVTLEDIRSGKIEVSVQAIEMVYVPVGPYYLGDRNSPYSFVNQQVDKGMLINNDDEQTLYAGGQVIDGTSYEEEFHIPVNYPMGYTGFYTMKYEVSQEQYVNFLNRITLRDQRKRIGRNFDDLEAGDYVFGESANRKEPSYRNGIVLVEKYTVVDTPAVFGFNLSGLTPPNFPDDGKDIACNFLSPDDLMAYLDWAGLRPHSETEFEKSCRERNPQSFLGDDSWAWGLSLPQPLEWPHDVANSGEDNELIVNNKNVNGAIAAPYPAPVRAGAFANASTTTLDETGASCWGIMELSGNLAEIYYNVDSTGSCFRGDIFGDGNIWSTVCTWDEDSILTIYKTVSCSYDPRDSAVVRFSHRIHYPVMSKRGKMMEVVIEHNKYWRDCKFEQYNYDWRGNCTGKVISTTLKVPFPYISWPAAKEAFGLRGGSFNDDLEENLAVSYRGKANYYTLLDSSGTRLRYSGFRGGRSVPLRSIVTGRIAGMNHLERDTAIICPGNAYTISEWVAGEDDPMSTVFEWEINDGSGWKQLADQYSKDLLIDWTLNDSIKWHEYRFRRKSVASHAEAYSNEVTLCVPGVTVSGEGGLQIDAFNTSADLVIDLGATAQRVTVWWTPGNGVTPASVFNEVNLSGLQTITLERIEFDPPIDYGDNAVIDLTIYVEFEDCTYEYTRRLDIERYAYVENSENVNDPGGNSYVAKQMGGDTRLWLTTELRYEFNAGSSGSFSWPASTNGEYTIQHLKAVQAGKLQLCPDGYEIPDAEDFAYLLSGYDTYDPSTNLNSWDEGTSTLYDPGLSTFINQFFDGFTGGSASWSDMDIGFWTSDGSVVYKFSQAGELLFGPVSYTDGSGNVDLGLKYKVRCVKKRVQ